MAQQQRNVVQFHLVFDGKHQPAISGANIDIVFTPQINQWNGSSDIQLKMKDVNNTPESENKCIRTLWQLRHQTTLYKRSCSFPAGGIFT